MKTADAHLTYDIAQHAQNEAMETLKRITETAPFHLQNTTALLACAMLESKLRIVREAMGGPLPNEILPELDIIHREALREVMAQRR